MRQLFLVMVREPRGGCCRCRNLTSCRYTPRTVEEWSDLFADLYRLKGDRWRAEGRKSPVFTLLADLGPYRRGPSDCNADNSSGDQEAGRSWVR